MRLKPFLYTVAELALLANVGVVFANLFALLVSGPVMPDLTHFVLLVTTHAAATFLTAGLFTNHAAVTLWPWLPRTQRQQVPS